MVDVFLAELRNLTTHFGGMTERGLVCAFIAGLPEHAENLLQATTRVDDLPISEILARARAILKDSLTGTESATAAAQLPGCQEKGATALRRCYVCQEPNHMARDCPRRRGSPRSPKTLICYQCKRQGHVARNCPGNERGDESSAPVFPPDLIWMALCLQSVCRLTGLGVLPWWMQAVHKPCCQTWKKKQVPLLVVGGNSSMCCGESVVQIGIGNGPSVAVRALVVDVDLFGYDLLLGLNAIRQLGGMTVWRWPGIFQCAAGSVLQLRLWNGELTLWQPDGTTKHKTPCCVGCLTKLWWDHHKLIQHVVTGVRMVRKSHVGGCQLPGHRGGYWIWRSHNWRRKLATTSAHR